MTAIDMPIAGCGSGGVSTSGVRTRHEDALRAVHELRCAAYAQGVADGRNAQALCFRTRTCLSRALEHYAQSISLASGEYGRMERAAVASARAELHSLGADA